MDKTETRTPASDISLGQMLAHLPMKHQAVREWDEMRHLIVKLREREQALEEKLEQLEHQPPSSAEISRRATEEIAAERTRQMTEEGFTIEDDDGLRAAALSDAGACYAMVGHDKIQPADLWPFEPSSFKPADMRWNLVRAAALIVAEIERIDRWSTV